MVVVHTLRTTTTDDELGAGYSSTNTGISRSVLV
jgi:hypothetical protein